MDKNTTSEIELFVDANKETPSRSRNFLKTVSNFISGKRSSESIVVPDESYSENLSDIVQFDGFSDISQSAAIQEFTTLSTNRFKQFSMYSDMEQSDTLISAALDLYSDDSTQISIDGRQVWAKSRNPEYQKLIDNFIVMLRIEENIRSIARKLAKYGEVFIELFYDEDAEFSQVKLVESLHSGSHSIEDILTESSKSIELSKTNKKISNYYEIVDDPENLFELQVYGKTVAFARVTGSQDSVGYSEISGYIAPNFNSKQVIYYPADKFVHICLDSSSANNSKFIVSLDDGSKFAFTVRSGKSMLFDVFRSEREKRLLEYSMMLNRVSRSSIFRLAQIEVGNYSPTKVQATLRRVKQMIENKTSMNLQDGAYQPYNNPGPIENFLYIPTRDGKGSVSIDTIGGDVNIRDIADIEYYTNKVFAGLKIPKAFLNFGDDSLSPFSGGETLTKLDARYARTVKMLQSFVINGITDMINIYLDNRGKGEVIGNYDIMMTLPASSEDIEREESFQRKTDITREFLDSVEKLSGLSGFDIDGDRLVSYISDSIFNDGEFSSIFKGYRSEGDSHEKI